MILNAVYMLCALTSLACALLLLRSWRTSRRALLFWSGMCFLGLMLNNALLFIDQVVVPAIDLSTIVKVPAVIGLAVFLTSLIWERE
jgi:hypothetical protein